MNKQEAEAFLKAKGIYPEQQINTQRSFGRPLQSQQIKYKLSDLISEATEGKVESVNEKMREALQAIKGVMPFHDGDFTVGESKAMSLVESALSSLPLEQENTTEYWKAKYETAVKQKSAYREESEKYRDRLIELGDIKPAVRENLDHN